MQSGNVRTYNVIDKKETFSLMSKYLSQWVKIIKSNREDNYSKNICVKKSF